MLFATSKSPPKPIRRHSFKFIFLGGPVDTFDMHLHPNTYSKMELIGLIAPSSNALCGMDQQGSFLLG